MRSDRELEIDPASTVGGQFSIERTAAFSHSGHERNHLFMSRGGKQFLDIAGVSGLDDAADGRVFSLLDFDRDGWLDIVTVNANNPLLRLYRNRIGDRPEAAAAGRSIAVRLVGANHSGDEKPGAACRDGYGAKVRLGLGDLEILREHRCGEGMAGQNSATMLVGIGARERVDKLTVEWPSGDSQETANVPSGSLVTVYQDATQSPSGEAFTIVDYGAPVTTDLAPVQPSASGTPLAIHRRGANVASLPTLSIYTTMATWCPKCKGELAQLETLKAAFPSGELALHGVPLDPEDTPTKLEQYVAEYQPAYVLRSDLSPRQLDSVRQVVRDALHIEGDAFPATVVVDSEGTILLTRAGVPSVSELKRLLDGNSSRH